MTMKGISLLIPPLNHTGLVLSLDSLSTAGYKWQSGSNLSEWLPPAAKEGSGFNLFVCCDLSCYQSPTPYTSLSHVGEWYYYKNTFDEVTMSAFNLMGQDLGRTATFLWEQGYTQQLIDKLTNGATVSELLSRGESYD